MAMITTGGQTRPGSVPSDQLRTDTITADPEVRLSMLAGAVVGGPPTHTVPVGVDPLPVQRERTVLLLERLTGQRRKHAARLEETGDDTGLFQALDTGDWEQLRELGVDLSHIQVPDVVGPLVTGERVIEIETIGPYGVHHLQTDSGVAVRSCNLPGDEQIGMALGAMLRDVLSGIDKVRFVALMDDLTGDTMASRTRSERDLLIIELYHLLRSGGVLRPNDIPGHSHLLLRESLLADRFDTLVEGLERSASGSVERIDGDDLVFLPEADFVATLVLRSPNRRKEFRRNGIRLTSGGSPTCPALDAAGFLDPANRAIVHVLMLGREWMSQQDRTYALIRALDLVRPSTFHNIFVDPEQIGPDGACLVVAEALTGELRRQLASMN